MMEKQLLLVRINNQCACVQQEIAKHYESPVNRELLYELGKLIRLLEDFLREKSD